MTVLEVSDVLRILIAKSTEITQFESEILFKILLSHTGQKYTRLLPKRTDVRNILLALINTASSLSRGDVKSCYRISIEHGKCPICAGCKKEIKSIRHFSWDHKNPKCYGGADSVINMQPMHKWCNNFKGNKLGKISTEAYLTHAMQLQYDLDSEKEKRPCKKDLHTKRHHIRLNGWWDIANFMEQHKY